MSDIPFVNQLGDAIEAAVRRPAKRTSWLRRGRSSRAAVVLAAIVGLSGGVALAGGLLTSNTPIQLATAGPMCYLTSTLHDGFGPSNNELLPVPACAQTRRQLGLPPRALVACVSDHTPGGFPGVAVFPARGSDACQRAGLKPLPAGYLAALGRVAALENSLAKLEPCAVCIPPARLAAQVQTLLDRGRWAGWHAALRTAPREGPCGSVTGLTGGAGSSFRGSIYSPDRVVAVFAEPYPSTLNLLDSPRAATLLPATGERCFSQTSIRHLVRGWLGASSRAVRYDVSVEHVSPPGRAADERATGNQPPPSRGLNDGRQRQLASGCAVIASIGSSPDGYNLVVDVWQGA